MTQALERGVRRARLSPSARARTREFFEAEAERLARLCHRMAERFARGGRLIAFGALAGGAVGRPARGRRVRAPGDRRQARAARDRRWRARAATSSDQVALAAEPDDIAIGFGAPRTRQAAAALGVARERGCLTLAFARAGAEWEFEPPSSDPSVRQELVETLYHVLWELVHVFFDHRGLLEGREARPVHDTGASSFLYPFLASASTTSRRSWRTCAARCSPRRERWASCARRRSTENGAELAARPPRASRDLDAGGTLLALGNGGSATDAMDVVADFRRPPDPRWPPRRALDLTEDPAILTAIANDIGTEAIFSRQVIAYGREGDACSPSPPAGTRRT